MQTFLLFFLNEFFGRPGCTATDVLGFRCPAAGTDTTFGDHQRLPHPTGTGSTSHRYRHHTLQVQAPHPTGTGSTPYRYRHHTQEPHLTGTGTTPDRYTGTTPYRYTGTTPYRYTRTTPYRYTGTTPYRYTGATPDRYTGATPDRYRQYPLGDHQRRLSSIHNKQRSSK